MVLNTPVRRFIDMIGHDGSAKPYDERPQQEAGFHEQECIEVAQKLGFACTPIEIVPQMLPAPGCKVSRPVWFPPHYYLRAVSEETNWRRFCQHLEGTCGVLTGLKKKISDSEIGHAVAWGHNNEIYDPQGKGFIYSLSQAPNFGFTPRVYWKIQEVKDA